MADTGNAWQAQVKILCQVRIETSHSQGKHTLSTTVKDLLLFHLTPCESLLIAK